MSRIYSRVLDFSELGLYVTASRYVLSAHSGSRNSQIRTNRASRRRIGSQLRRFGRALVDVTTPSHLGPVFSTIILTSMAGIPAVATAAEIAAGTLPTGANIIAGGITIDTNAATMNINQAQTNGIINWDSFGIGRDATVNFNNGSGTTLNRVVGSGGSQIMGKLTATGTVMVLNSNGVIFGANSRVDTASLIVTTSDISNDNFLADNMVFDKPGNPAAAIINHGTITAGNAGLVGLVAPIVENHGVINARLGRVELASADMFTLDMYGDGLIQVGVSDAVASQIVKNTGSIKAEGGVVVITAAAARNAVDQLVTISGDVNVSSISSKGGNIIFSAGGTDAGYGEVRIAGAKIDASSASKKGGTVDIFAGRIRVKDSAVIKADGATGGGNVRIGGDYLGSGDMLKADYTIIEDGSMISADATGSGDGGRIIIWSDHGTQFYGDAYARGGKNSGNGGFIETSGKDMLIVTGLGHAYARVADGQSGTWLLDPNNITIQDAGPNTNIAGDPSWVTSNDSAILTTASIETALNAGTSVTVTTGVANTNLQDGDIVVNNDIDKTTGGSATLSLIAHDDIIFNSANITSSSNALNVVLNADSDATGGGSIAMTSSSITSNGGNITLGGGANPLTTAAIGNGSSYQYGIALDNGDLSAGAGTISIRGQGDSAGSSNYGISIINGSSIQTTSGSITIAGQGGAGVNENIGTYIGSSSLVTSQTGDITITGNAGNGSGANQWGVLINGGADIISSATGASASNISITGVGGDGTGTDAGVYILGTGTSVTAVDGDISITGTGGGGTGTNKWGIVLTSGADIISTGTGSNAGTTTLLGTGGAGSSNNYGVYFDGAGTTLTTLDSGISITGNAGNGSSSANYGVYVNNGANILSTGTNNNTTTFSVTGKGGNGTGLNYGVYVNGASSIGSAESNLTVTGTGGNGSAADNYGVYLGAGGKIISTGSGTDVATITVNGTGGNGTGVDVGVHLNGATSAITSAEGNISVTGTGGAGTGANKWGVLVNNGADIISTGSTAAAADITIVGNAGSGTTNNYGVYLNASGSTVTSAKGDISITGTGAGSSSDNYGIYIYNGGVSSTGTGSDAATITLLGTGGAGTTGNYGVRFYDTAALITSAYGDISITGIGGSDGTNDWNIGVYGSSGADITSTGTGVDAANITIVGTGANGTDTNRGVLFESSGTTVTTVDGDIDITGVAGDGSTDYNQGIVLDASTVSSTGTGANAGTITLDGTGGDGTFRNYGVWVFGGLVTSIDGNIGITGVGDGSTTENRGIFVSSGGDITSTGTTSGAATITLVGTGGTGTYANVGVELDGSGTTITSDYGAIDITGTANGDGTDGGNVGITIDNSADIASTGTGADAATITLLGTGGNGTSVNHGVEIYSTGALITSIDGAISITGTGGAGSSSYNNGIRFYSDADITSTGTGANAATITLDGTGGTGNGESSGIRWESSGTTITSVAGDVSLTGVGGTGGSNNHGLRFDQEGVTVTGSADISLIGSVAGSGNSIYSVSASNSFGGSSMTGDILISLDNIAGITNITTDTDGGLTVKQTTASTTIGVGGGTGTLQVTQAFLDMFTWDGFLTIGSTSATGNMDFSGITYSGDLSLLGASASTIDINTAPSLGANGDFTVNAGTVIVDSAITTTGGGTISLTGSTSVDINQTLTTTGGGSITLTGGAIDLGASLTGTGITLNSATTISTVVTLDANTGTLTTGSTIAAGANDLNLYADDFVLGGVMSGTGDLDIGTSTSGSTLGIGAGQAGDATLTDPEVGYINSGSWDDITFRGQTSSQNINLGAVTWGSDIAFRTNTGTLTVNGNQDFGSNYAGFYTRTALAGTGTLTGTGGLGFQPDDSSNDLGVGTGATGDMRISDTFLSQIQDGFSKVQFYVNTGNLNVNTAHQFADAVEMWVFGNNGTINIDGALDVASGSDASFEFKVLFPSSRTGATLNINAAIDTTGATGDGQITVNGMDVINISGNLTTQNANIDLSDAQNSAVTITANSVWDAGTGTISTGSSGISAGAFDLSLFADGFVIGGEMTGDALRIGTSTSGVAMGIGTGTTAELISDTEQGYIDGGWTSIMFDNQAEIGDLNISAHTWTDAVTFDAGTGTITTTGIQTMGANNLSIYGDDLVIGAALNGSGNLYIGAGTAGVDFGIGDGMTGGQLSDAELDNVDTGSWNLLSFSADEVSGWDDSMDIFLGANTWTSDVLFVGDDDSITVSGAQNFGANNATFTSNTEMLGTGTLTGTGTLSFQLTSGNDLSIGSATAGAGLYLTDTFLGQIQDGFSQLNFNAKAGDVDINTTHQFADPTTFYGQWSSIIDVDGALSTAASSDASFTFNATNVGQELNINAAIDTSNSTSNGGITISDMDNGINIAVDLTTGAGGNIDFSDADNGAITLTANSVWDAGTGTISTGSSGISAGANDLSLFADGFVIGGEMTGDALRIGTSTSGVAMGIGTGQTAELFSNVEQAFIDGGWTSITFNNQSDVGDLNVGAATWTDTVTFDSGTAALNINGIQTMGTNDLRMFGDTLAIGAAINGTGDLYVGTSTDSGVTLGLGTGQAGATSLTDVEVANINTGGWNYIYFLSQNYGNIDINIGATTWTNGVNFRSGSGVLTFNGNQNFGANDAWIDSDSTLAGTGTLSGTANLNFVANTGAIAVGNAATGSLKLTETFLGQIQDGFATLVFRPRGPGGNTNVNTTHQFADPVVFTSWWGSNGTTNILGDLSAAAGSNGSFTFQRFDPGSTDTVNITANISTAGVASGGAITFTGMDVINIGGNLTTQNAAIDLSDANNAAATITANSIWNAGTGTINTGTGTLSAGANNLTLTADEVIIGSALDGSGNLLLQASTNSTAYNIGNGVTAGFDLSVTELGRIGAGTAWNQVTIGNAASTGVLAFGNWTLGSDLALRAGSIAGSGSLNVGAGALSLIANAGSINHSAGTLTAGAATFDAQTSIASNFSFASLNFGNNATSVALTGLLGGAAGQVAADLILGGPGDDAGYTFNGFTIRFLAVSKGGSNNYTNLVYNNHKVEVPHEAATEFSRTTPTDSDSHILRYIAEEQSYHVSYPASIWVDLRVFKQQTLSFVEEVFSNYTAAISQHATVSSKPKQRNASLRTVKNAGGKYRLFNKRKGNASTPKNAKKPMLAGFKTNIIGGDAYQAVVKQPTEESSYVKHTKKIWIDSRLVN